MGGGWHVSRVLTGISGPVFPHRLAKRAENTSEIAAFSLTVLIVSEPGAAAADKHAFIRSARFAWIWPGGIRTIRVALHDL